MASLFSAINPSGAAVGWSQTCNFWRSAAGACPVSLAVSGGGTFHGRVAIKGRGFLGSVKIGCTLATSCVGSNGYVTANASSVVINIWKALADGAWSSSCLIDVYTGSLAGGSDNVFLTPEPFTALPAQVITSNNSTACAGCCPSFIHGTITVFDDGTFTYGYVP